MMHIRYRPSANQLISSTNTTQITNIITD